jgi:hypothetical protein
LKNKTDTVNKQKISATFLSFPRPSRKEKKNICSVSVFVVRLFFFFVVCTQTPKTSSFPAKATAGGWRCDFCALDLVGIEWWGFFVRMRDEGLSLQRPFNGEDQGHVSDILCPNSEAIDGEGEKKRGLVQLLFFFFFLVG